MDTPEKTLEQRDFTVYRAKKTAAFMYELHKLGLAREDAAPLALAAEELVASVVADMTIHNSHPKE